MSAVDEIRAAIEKLKELRSLSNDRQFEVTKSDGHSYMGSLSIVESVAPEAISPVDADLIVTLHRTIDAQIGVLSDALSLYEDPIPMFMGREDQVCWHQIALARAINGADPAVTR